jgi:hypothetical protein
VKYRIRGVRYRPEFANCIALAQKQRE